MNTLQLLNDNTICHDIDTSGSASEHQLGELACIAGHSSLTSCLNDWRAWGDTVGHVAALLVESIDAEKTD